MWRTVAWNLLVSLCQRNFRIWYSLYECEWCLRSDSISHVLKINLLCTMLNHESQLRAITTSLPRWNVQVQLYTVHHIGWPWPTLKTKHCAKYLWFSWLVFMGGGLTTNITNEATLPTFTSCKQCKQQPRTKLFCPPENWELLLPSRGWVVWPYICSSVRIFHTNRYKRIAMRIRGGG